MIVNQVKAMHVVRVRTNRSFGEIVESGLRLSGLSPVSWALADRDVAVVDVYAAGGDEARDLLATVRDRVSAWADGEAWSVSRRRLAYEDWAEAWKKHFKVERVSERIVIKPPWKRVAVRRGQVVVEIEPGMSFGTGQHPTTRSCLRLLDDLTGAARGRTRSVPRGSRREGAPFRPGKECSLLDIGCGSGILAIAAEKLGFTPVKAVDNDPVAVRIAKENARRNGVGRKVIFKVADLARMKAERRYDVVVANILAGVLVRYAGNIVRFLEVGAGGRLILSGILTAQYAEVKSAYEAEGLCELRRLRDGKWTSGCFGRSV